MKGPAVAVAALAVLLGDGGAAYAAGTIRVDVFPDRPRVGQVTTIHVRTFVLLDGTPPWIYADDFGWSIAALSSHGRRVPVRIAREADNPYQWSGTFRFPSSGAWALWVFNFARDPVMPLRVQVRARGAHDDVWTRLRRPLRIPSIAGGTSCPVSSPDPRGDLALIGSEGRAWGQGPAYPVGLGSAEGGPALRYLDPIPQASEFSGSRWFGQKVLWVVDPVYRGPLLIRGRQLDGPNELRFDKGVVPPREIRIDSSAPPRQRPSYTRVQAPGCYAYQIDGLGFTRLIVFVARPGERAREDSNLRPTA
jgi:hypothetical protein